MTFGEFFNEYFKNTEFSTGILKTTFREVARNAWNEAIVEASNLAKETNPDLALKIIEKAQK